MFKNIDKNNEIFKSDAYRKDVVPFQLLELIKENGKAVAMARSSRENGEFVAVNGVYTLPEHRNKGYASAIVACISDFILQNGKTPALYTDLSNPSSNRAYKNIGFTEQTPIDQVYLDWSK